MFALYGMSIRANIINRFFQVHSHLLLTRNSNYSTNLDLLFHQTMRFSNVKTESTEYFILKFWKIWRDENHELEIGYALDTAVRMGIIILR